MTGTNQSPNISLLPLVRTNLHEVAKDPHLVLDLRTSALLVVLGHNLRVGEHIVGGEGALLLRRHHQLAVYH